VPRIFPQDFRFQPGKAEMLRPGNDVALLANGVMVGRALEAAALLEKRGVQARVLNMSSIKPVDEQAILDAARQTRGIVTAEEGLRAGGLGGMVAEIVSTQHCSPMRILGVPDIFAPTGTAPFLLEHFGLTAQGITNAALELLGGGPSGA
jgi:transketolase